MAKASYNGNGASGWPDKPAVTIVLPCLNEEESIAACVEEAQLGLSEAGVSGEVLIADNGSTDRSVEIAEAAGARVVHEPVRGYGSALRCGIREAKGRVVVMADADMTYDLSRVGELTGPVLAGDVDLMLGARLDGSNRGTMPFLHRFVGTPSISFLLRRACGGLTIRDSQSGYRAFSADKIGDLELKATGMEFASEMLIRSSQAGLRIGETSIGYRPRLGDSKLNTFTDGWRHLQLILLLAPQLLLVWPGLVMLGMGIGLSILSLLNPVGFELGSLRWQPVFFAPILIILGLMAATAGAVLAYHSPLTQAEVARHFRFVGNPRFSGRCMSAGLISLGSGVVIDIVLFFAWVDGGPAPARALSSAALAQSLIIAGAMLAGFGLIYRMLVRQTGYRSRQGDVDILQGDLLRAREEEQFTVGI